MNADPARVACAERCAEFGDPPCWEVHADRRAVGLAFGAWQPCDDCLSDIGVEVLARLDPDAVVKDLFA